MKIKFTQAHAIGIPEGTVRKVTPKFGNRMIEKGAAEEVSEDTPETPTPKKEKGSAGASLQKHAEKKAEADKKDSKKKDSEKGEADKKDSKKK